MAEDGDRQKHPRKSATPRKCLPDAGNGVMLGEVKEEPPDDEFLTAFPRASALSTTVSMEATTSQDGKESDKNSTHNKNRKKCARKNCTKCERKHVHRDKQDSSCKTSEKSNKSVSSETAKMKDGEKHEKETPKKVKIKRTRQKPKLASEIPAKDNVDGELKATRSSKRKRQASLGSAGGNTPHKKRKVKEDDRKKEATPKSPLLAGEEEECVWSAQSKRHRQEKSRIVQACSKDGSVSRTRPYCWKKKNLETKDSAQQSSSTSGSLDHVDDLVTLTKQDPCATNSECGKETNRETKSNTDYDGDIAHKSPGPTSPGSKHSQVIGMAQSDIHDIHEDLEPPCEPTPAKESTHSAENVGNASASKQSSKSVSEGTSPCSQDTSILSSECDSPFQYAVGGPVAGEEQLRLLSEQLSSLNQDSSNISTQIHKKHTPSRRRRAGRTAGSARKSLFKTPSKSLPVTPGKPYRLRLSPSPSGSSLSPGSANRSPRGLASPRFRLKLRTPTKATAKRKLYKSPEGKGKSSAVTFGTR